MELSAPIDGGKRWALCSGGLMGETYPSTTTELTHTAWNPVLSEQTERWLLSSLLLCSPVRRRRSPELRAEVRIF